MALHNYICYGCEHYNPYFFMVYNQTYNKSECGRTGKKVTLAKIKCKYKKLILFDSN